MIKKMLQHVLCVFMCVSVFYLTLKASVLFLKYTKNKEL